MMKSWKTISKNLILKGRLRVDTQPTIAEAKQKPTFTDNMRFWFKGILDPIATFFNAIGLTPNTITLLGVTGNAIGAFLLSQGRLLEGGILVLLMGPLDALDGTMARLRGEASNWGAFVDSVSDRYSELLIMAGLVYYYHSLNNTLGVMLVFFAAAGSVLVSYTKARAETLKFDANVGILTRMERYMILAPGLVLGYLNPMIPMIAIGIIAVFANFTALQRIWRVRRQVHASWKQNTK
jgi:CDP-diacylglycerol--glycerol-3-phosphate 3-phosphatidyltransferase